ncbi:MAG: hypothetical protein ACP5U2_10450 [Bryobacteraceae bacterium]
MQECWELQRAVAQGLLDGAVQSPGLLGLADQARALPLAAPRDTSALKRNRLAARELLCVAE